MSRPAVLCDDCGYLLTDGDQTDCHASDYIAELEAEYELLVSTVSETLSNMEYYSLGEMWLVQDKDITAMRAALQGASDG